MKLRQVMCIFIVLLAISIVAAFAYGKPIKNKPIHINFVEKPLKEVYSHEVYTLEVFWNNKDNLAAHEGAFVFMVQGKNFQVSASDITFVFEDSVIDSQISGDILEYVLPQHTFPAEGIGSIIVHITYHNAGKYFWRIGIKESP